MIPRAEDQRPVVVVAIGGNALLRRGEPPDIAHQRHALVGTAQALVPLASEHRLVITHGNGPQVGVLAMQAEALPELGALPLDVLDAESMGLVGYLITEALTTAEPELAVAAVLTRVTVDPDDPAFADPTKPIGPVLSEREASRRERDHGWRFVAEGGGRRRVVASPAPRRILELAAIRRLVDGGIVTIAAGGGGIPVVERAGGGWSGVEAVIDKDRTSARLAVELDADRLVILTDVDGVYADWGTSSARRIDRISLSDTAAIATDRGGMGPKLLAASQFVRETGRDAVIGALSDADAVLSGTAGTTVVM
ncbi:MAG: carbamate kinase [Acidimicrobiales bacterium]|nr:carbamate kinase [Acidimicrobiales bacterium]